MKAEPASTYCAHCNTVKVTSKSFGLNYRSPVDGLKSVKFCKLCTEDFAERYLLLTREGQNKLRKIYATWRKR